MFKQYFQLTRQFTNSFISSNNLFNPGVSYKNHITKRWAGHAKWQNIKATKQAMDQMKSNAFFKISKQIENIFREGGSDAVLNEKLNFLWEDAKKLNMPRSTFDNRIKVLKNSLDKPFWTVFSGPKGVVLGFEVIFANRNLGFLQTKFSPQTKKLKLKMEPHFHDLCTEKGIIITEPLPDVENAYDKAVEHAINIGVDEVFENDDKTLIFECLPDRVDTLQQKLNDLNYNILSASTELEFKEFITVNEEEMENLEYLINKLKGLHKEIIRASFNVVRP